MDSGDQFQKDLLGYVAGGSLIAVKEIQRNRIDAIFVGLVKHTNRIPIAYSTGFEDLFGDVPITERNHWRMRRGSEMLSSRSLGVFTTSCNSQSGFNVDSKTLGSYANIWIYFSSNIACGDARVYNRLAIPTNLERLARDV